MAVRSYLWHDHGASHPEEWLSPLPSQARWHNHVFTPFQKAGRVGACLNSGGKLFQREGATAEKALLLDPANRQSLMNRVHNMPSLPDRVGWIDVMGVRWSLR